MATKREHLGKNFGYGGISIDMEEVYRKIDSGLTIEEVASELGVHRSTLHRKHKIYQNQLELLEKTKQTKEIESLIPRIPPGAL